MKRAIVAFMVVVGMALVTAGCGGPSDDTTTKSHPAGMPATTPMPPAEKAPAPAQK
ncbi:MAG: hypothetical protein ACLQVA_02015 [Candidatus Brocadiia bacterium]